MKTFTFELVWVLVFASCAGKPHLSSEANLRSKARQTLLEFVDAVEAGRFENAYSLLSVSWRAQYSPERFRKDFLIEAGAKDRLARARIAAASTPTDEGNYWVFEISPTHGVRLVLENGEFRVLSLE